jgi:type IV fimbrial biogenesis protein FimT
MDRQHRDSGNSNGFSLMELLICLLIAGLIFSFGGNLTRTLQREQAYATINELRRLLSYARHEAILRSGRVTLCAADQTGKCSKHWDQNHAIVFIDENLNRRLEPNETLLRQESIRNRRGQLTWRASLGRPYIEFQEDGGTAQNGTFRFCPEAADAAAAVIVNRAGRNYVGEDRNKDGIREDSRGKNLNCHAS